MPYAVGDRVLVRRGLTENMEVDGVLVGTVAIYSGRVITISQVMPSGLYRSGGIVLSEGMIEGLAPETPTTSEEPVPTNEVVNNFISDDVKRITTEFHFVNEEEAISFQDVKKFVHYFKTQLRIGVELEKDNTTNRTNELVSSLRPTRNYNKLGEFGVYDVVRDGSLSENGQEVLVIGTNEEFSSWHRRMKAIHEKLKELGYHENQKCGMHYHLLTVQQELVPEVILKNLYQLVRYYADALIWVSSCQRGAGKNRGLNQWSNFARMMVKSPVGRSVRDLQSELGDRYVAFNIWGRGYHATHRGERGFLVFNNNRLEGIHVEFRWPDGSDSPAHICALGNLFRAMVLKAVEVSEFGIIHVDHNRGDWQTLKERVQRISNGYSLSEADQEACRAKAKQLIKTVRNQLLAFDGTSVMVLEKIGDTPPSALKNLGRSWAKIENYYYPEHLQEVDVNSELRKAIIRQKVVGCKTKREWETKMAQVLGLGSFETLRDRMDALKRLGVSFYWDKDIGAYLWVF